MWINKCDVILELLASLSFSYKKKSTARFINLYQHRIIYLQIESANLFLFASSQQASISKIPPRSLALHERLAIHERLKRFLHLRFGNNWLNSVYTRKRSKKNQSQYLQMFLFIQFSGAWADKWANVEWAQINK